MQQCCTGEVELLYEFRVYEPHEGKADAMLRRFREHTLRIFPRHGIEVLGLFEVQPADGRIVYLTRFESEQARGAAWAAFGADPEWQRIKAESERDGALLKSQSVTIISPVQAGLLLA